MLLADLPSLPGSNVSKGDLPDGPKPLSGDAGSKVCTPISHCCVDSTRNCPDVLQYRQAGTHLN